MKPISLTQGMKNGLSALSNLQDQIASTNNRLATGRKVNSALDNPLNFFIADSFNQRARSLQSIQENIGLGLNVIKQADKALTSIRSSIEQAEGTLRAAMNSAGTNARTTTSFAFRNATTGAADATVNFFEAATGTSTDRLQSGDSFTINLATFDANGAVVGTLGTVTVSNGASTVQQVIDAINTTGGASAFNVAGQSQRVYAYLNDAGNLVIEAATQGRDASGNTFGISFAMTNASGATQNGLTAFNFSGAAGQQPSATNIGTTGQVITMVGGSTVQATRASAATAFREVLNQVRNTSVDAGYNGTNLLQGDFLRTQFNEDNTTSITTQGRRVDASTLGFTADNVVGQTGDAVRNFQSDRELSNALGKLRVAKESVNSLQTSFAANANLMTNRNDYTRESVRNLKDGADLLTLADINEEGANLASLQTRQQLAVQSLSLANQSDQAVLRLLG